MLELEFRNRQRKWPLNLERIQEITHWVAADLFQDVPGEVSVQFLGPDRMAQVNWDYLQHEGPTDVITFDLSGDESGELLMGELLVCPSVAANQSTEFKTSWQHETMRYIVHGLLHLKGYDDLEPEKRRVMKREENAWMRRVEARFDLGSISEV